MNEFGFGGNWFGGATGIPRGAFGLGKIATILARLLLVRIGKMIESNKESLRVPCKEQIEKNDRGQNGCQEFADGESCCEIEHHVDNDAQDASCPVVDDPRGGQEVARLPLVSISASRTAIEWHEPVPQRSGGEERWEDG